VNDDTSLKSESFNTLGYSKKAGILYENTRF